MDFRWLSRGAAAAERMRLRGMTPNGHLLWQQYESDNLRFGHPDYRGILARNVRRTLPAHYSKAGRLGITKSREWQDNDLLKLHRHFSRATRAELEGMFPNRTWRAICRKAWADGYRRPVRIPKATGNSVLDAILLRASTRNWSLGDLDVHCRAKGYFARRKWRHGQWKHAYHFRAVELLGGHLEAIWR